MPLLTTQSARGYGFTSFIAAGPNDYESIATFEVTSGTQPFAEFTAIPTTYKHLQLRVYYKGTQVQNPYVQLGTGGTLDTATNYWWHHFWTSGVGANNSNNAQSNFMYYGYNANSAYPAACIIDLIDYTNTDTFKVMKSLSGSDNVGSSGEVTMFTGHWRNKGVIERIRLTPGGGSWDTTSHFALYGIKG